MKVKGTEKISGARISIATFLDTGVEKRVVGYRKNLEYQNPLGTFLETGVEKQAVGYSQVPHNLNPPNRKGLSVICPLFEIFFCSANNLKKNYLQKYK